MDGTLWYTHSQGVQFRDTISLAPLLKEVHFQTSRTQNGLANSPDTCPEGRSRISFCHPCSFRFYRWNKVGRFRLSVISYYPFKHSKFSFWSKNLRKCEIVTLVIMCLLTNKVHVLTVTSSSWSLRNTVWAWNLTFLPSLVCFTLKLIYLAYFFQENIKPFGVEYHFWKTPWIQRFSNSCYGNRSLELLLTLAPIKEAPLCG